MEIEVKKLFPEDVNDFSELIKVFEVAFEMENFKIPDSKHLQGLLSKPDFFTLVAKHNNTVVGGLTVYILHSYYSTSPSAYIYDVGVLPAYRRKGIGKKLITYLVNYCKHLDISIAFVQAETEDIQAVNFYKTTAFNSEVHATQFTYSIENTNPGNKK